MHLRLTATLTATALTACALAVPHASAAPEVTLRESMHGQYLCTVAHGADDRQAVEALADAYAATLQSASKAVQAKYPQFSSTFNAVDAALTPATLLQLTQFPALSTKLKADGYNNKDIAAIVLGAKNPKALIHSNLDAVFLKKYPEASINRAQQYLDATASGGQAPLISSSEDYSATFKTDLTTAEANTNLAAALETFDATAGGSAVHAAWQDCISQLEAHGMKLGPQGVPQIEVPIYTNDGKNGSSASSAAVIAGLIGLAVFTVASAYVVNGGLQKNGMTLPFPLGV